MLKHTINLQNKMNLSPINSKMNVMKEPKHDNDYHELLGRLERANESLAFLKNNKEICVRDLHK